MIYSGADLIRTSGQQVAQVHKLHMADSVPPVASPTSANPQQKEDTQSALLRFARFVKDEARQKSSPKKLKDKKLPHGYTVQIQFDEEDLRHGQALDIYV